MGKRPYAFQCLTFTAVQDLAEEAVDMPGDLFAPFKASSLSAQLLCSTAIRTAVPLSCMTLVMMLQQHHAV